MSRRTLSFFVIAMFIILFLPVKAVEISFDGGVHFYPPGSTIEITYIHSVERSTVVEVLVANTSGFYAVEMKWKDFGAGLPEDIQGTVGDYYVKHVSDYLGEDFSYWFIPLNHVNITVNGSPVLNSPEKALLVNFRIKRVPLILTLIGRW
ncbi:DUF1850 domain-containing protein [Thermococcus piezophilus]|nr:DUF1850 domain-containing protein [Thermococcus piezophilus]